MLKGEADIVLKREVKAVLFDLDGVLVDSFEAWFQTFNDALNHCGFRPVTKRNFKKYFGAPIEYDAKKFFNGMGIDSVKRLYIKYFQKRIHHVMLFPQVHEVLRELKRRKYKIGLITNSTRATSRAIMNLLKLNKYFDAIIAMEDVKRRKPAPDMILKACKKLNAKPRNTILIGDTNNDIVAGRRAGCVTVGYKIKGDYRINKLNEVTRFT